ncbi:MAG: hypothetical protein AAF290_15110 [Pseudomonadota bacterium]
MMRTLVLAAITLLCTGCATSYTDVPVSEPHATITFQRNKAGVKAVNNEPFQGYDLLSDPQCTSFERITGFSFDGQFIKTARFPAGEKLHFMMHSVPNQNIYGQWCWSYLGFAPETGRDYVVMHESCTPVVYDKTEGDWQIVRDIDVIDGFECPKK